MSLVLAAGCGARTGVLVRRAADAGRADASVSADASAFDAPVRDAGDGCGAGQIRCGGVCTDVTSSNTDCGACGHACGTGERCDSGTCRSAVPPVLWAHALADAQSPEVSFAAPQVAVDHAGNVYVLTRGFTQTMPVDLGDGPIVPADQGGLFLVSYDKNGRYRWFHGIGSPRDPLTGNLIHGNDIAVAGRCIAVVGSFLGPTDFGHGLRSPLTDLLGADNGFVLCLDPDNGQARWDREMRGPLFVRATAVAPTATGALFVAGYYESEAEIGGTVLPDAGTGEHFTQCFSATYSADGDLLHTSWARTCGAMQALYDPRSSALYVAEVIEGLTDFGLGPIGNPGPTGLSSVLLRYGPSGEPVWQTLLTPGGNEIYALGLDPAGGVVLGGAFEAELSLQPSSVPAVSETNGRSGFVATVDPSGHGTSLRAIPSEALGVAKLSNGSVLTAGLFARHADFGGCQMTWSPDTSENDGDGFLVSTDSTGACEWALQIGTVAPSGIVGIPPRESDYIAGLTLSPSGHPVFVGCFNGSLDLGGVHLEATPIDTCTTFVAEMAAP